jgi:hypothetical protein
MQSSIELDLAEITPSHHRAKVSVNLVYDNMLTILFSVFVLLYYNRFPAGLGSFKRQQEKYANKIVMCMSFCIYIVLTNNSLIVS